MREGNKNIKVLVLGCGSIGQRHISNLRAIGVGEVIACDLDPYRAAVVREQYGISVFSCFSEALQDSPDAALICTHPANHLEAARLAVRADCHVFIEKPISNTLEGLEDLVHEAETRSRVICVGYNWRFHPSFLKLKQLIDDGAIGDALCARVNWGQHLPDWHPWEDYRLGYSARRSLGGGVLLDSHEFDYITWFLGEVERVSCIARRVSHLEIETEDIADVLLVFYSGAQASMHLDYLQRPAQRCYEFFGSQGTIQWSLGKGIFFYKASTGKRETFSDPADFDLNATYTEELLHFFSCIRNGAQSYTDARRGKYILELILAAKESSQTQRVVMMGPVMEAR
jgi:predicted dehydrogenase